MIEGIGYNLSIEGLQILKRPAASFDKDHIRPMLPFFCRVEPGNTCGNLFSGTQTLHLDRIEKEPCRRKSSFKYLAHILDHSTGGGGDEADGFRDGRNRSLSFGAEIARFGKFLEEFGKSLLKGALSGFSD